MTRCEAIAEHRQAGMPFPTTHQCQNNAKHTAPSGVKLCGVHLNQYRRLGFAGLNPKEDA